jgi:hypothetical protein
VPDDRKPGFSFPLDIPPTQSETQWLGIQEATGDVPNTPAPDLPVRDELPKPYLRLIK